MEKIKFKYLENGAWQTEECIVGNIAECKEKYGLGTKYSIDEYKFISIKVETEKETNKKKAM